MIQLVWAVIKKSEIFIKYKLSFKVQRMSQSQHWGKTEQLWQIEQLFCVKKNQLWQLQYGLTFVDQLIFAYAS